MTVEQAMSDARDQFPVGMRVLAVDDDPTCLRLLESLLRRCQYHVTATSQAITALQLLRQNKNKFDLVISDVHMPDMDGFKLLELVGLEMDLPVIMLSANGDPKLVMKGITHGACDYLLKPVRIEELKNIWQHVVRRKKFDLKDGKNSDSHKKPHHGSCEGAGAGDLDQDGKLNKKRKDQDEDEDEEHDENVHDNEDPSSQKKPRVVWSVELHRKFVDAVNQLGIDKAVPKKILELMNVEKLTRENVASHLQKYRLYLKRISCVANQQANMAAALGGTDSTYLRMSSLNGLGNYSTLVGSDQFHNTAFRSLPPGGMLGRLNTPTGLGLRGLPSSGVMQLGHLQNTENAANEQQKLHPVVTPGNHNTGILQGMPIALELDQLQHTSGVTRIGELPTAIDSTTNFPASGSFLDTRINGCSNNQIFGIRNNQLMLGHPHEVKGDRISGNQSSLTVASLNLGSSSHLPDLRRCSDGWSSAVQSSEFQPSSYLPSNSFKLATIHPNNLRDNVSSVLHNTSALSKFSSSPAPSQLQDIKPDVQCQAVNISCNVGQTNNVTHQEWNVPYHSNVMCSSINTSAPMNGSLASLGQSLDTSDTILCRAVGQSNFVDPLLMKRNEVGNSALDTSINQMGYLISQQKPQGHYSSDSFGSLEDLATVVVEQDQDKLKAPEGSLGFNAYSQRRYP